MADGSDHNGGTESSDARCPHCGRALSIVDLVGRRRGFAYSGLAAFALVLEKILAFFGLFASAAAGIYVVAKGYPFLGLAAGFFLCTGNLAWLVVLLRVEDLAAPAGDVPAAIVAGPSGDDAREDDTGEAVTCLRCGRTIPPGESTCPACGWSYKVSDASAEP